MSMQFIVSLQGDISAEVEATDLGLDTDNATEWFGDISHQVNLSDVDLSGSVTVAARAEVEDIEVEAYDLGDFDADAAFDEYVGPYGGVEASNVDFEITRSPTGFEVVEEALGDRDTAITAYAALARAGFEVN